MKKLLALVLALVMVMGLAAVGTNAAYLEDKYTDAGDVHYEEAVAVMSSVGVLEGFEGKFRPDVELKRSEAAKIVAYLITNNKTAENLVGVGKFSDVPANHWAAGYIEYLNAIQVFVGNGDNTCSPDADLQAVHLAKMLLVALGYDPTIEGLVGNDYEINVVKLATDAGLFNGMPDLKPFDVLTREEAAQMAFNTVKSPLVEYSNKGGSISINGADISLGASHFNYVTSTIAKDQNISDQTLTNSEGTNANTGYTVEFGERQYPDLRLNDEAEDPFGRPANEWTNGKETVGKFINWDLMVESYTTAVTGADLFEALGEATIKNSNINYKVNGYPVVYLDPESAEGQTVRADSGSATDAYRFYGIAPSNMIRSNKIPYGFTGNGVLTEVYEKGDDVIIVSILTYYAEADGDYNARSEELRIDVYAFDGDTSAPHTTYDMAGAHPAPTFISGETFPREIVHEDVPEIEKYEDGDKLLVRVAWDDGVNDFKVVEVCDPKEVLEDVTVSRFSQKAVGEMKNTAAGVTIVDKGLFYEGWLVTGGQTLDFSKAVYPKDLMSYDQQKLGDAFDVVIDPYGYVIATEAKSPGNKYVFIAGVDNYNSNLGLTLADAFAIFEDGASATIKVNVGKTDDNIAEYEDYREDNIRDKTGKKDGAMVNKYNGFEVGANYSIRYDLLSIDRPLHAYNRWFSYTVSGEGASAVYTLKPCANSLMVQNGSAINNLDGANPFINLRQPRLVGDQLYYDTPFTSLGNATNWNRTAWGNDNSLYITVRTAKVSAADYDGPGEGGKMHAYHTANDGSRDYKRGISAVESVVSGVQNIELDIWEGGIANTGKNPFQESIYAVYDKDHFIKAAIVLGDDGGDTGNYIYAISSAGSEWKEGSYYYWDFNAIMNGEETVLTVKDEYDDTISAIQAAVGFNKQGTVGGLFDVKMDKDGYVIDAVQIDWRSSAPGGSAEEPNGTNKVYANAQLGGEVNTAGDDYALRIGTSYKLYQSYFWSNDTNYVIGNTLYNKFDGTSQNGNFVSNDAYEIGSDVGLTIAAGAPIYVVQERYVPSNGQFITDVEKFSDFNSALGYIAKADGKTEGKIKTTTKFNGYVSAVLNNGNAKWVVLKNTETQIDINNNSGTSNGPTTRSVDLAYNPGVGFTITMTGFNRAAKVQLQMQGALATGMWTNIGTWNKSSTFTAVKQGSGVAGNETLSAGLVTAGNYYRVVVNDGEFESDAVVAYD